MSNYNPVESRKLHKNSENMNKFFEYGRSEGAPYLFYKHEEFCDLMGHEINFYPNGVLLTLRDDVKDFEESRSFVFYNNNGDKILDIHNRRSVMQGNIRSFLKPIKDIQVSVSGDEEFGGHIVVTETIFETGKTTEYLIDALTGEKDLITDEDQLTMDI